MKKDSPQRPLASDAAILPKERLSDSDLQRFRNRYKSLRDNRRTWEPDWKDIRDLTIPQIGKYLDGDSPSIGNNGQNRFGKIFDGSPAYAFLVLASGMVSGNIPSSLKWFKLRIKNEQMMNSHDVKLWLEIVEEMIYGVFSSANFYSRGHTGFLQTAMYGTYCMGIFEDLKSIVSFQPLSIGTYYLSNGSDGEADTIYRDLYFTSAQLLEQFGKENLPETIVNELSLDQTETLYHVIHAVEPNDFRMKCFGKWKYRSVYYLNRFDREEAVLSVGGYERFPFVVLRWMVDTADAYGVASPGYMTLSDMKALNKLTKKSLRAVDLSVDPPLMADSSMQHERIFRDPGDISFVNLNGPSGSVQGLKPLYQVQYDVSGNEAMKANTLQRIRQNCFVDLFLMMASVEKDKKTAYEVAKLYEEKQQVLGPVIENVQNAFLRPCIETVFSILTSYDMLPPPPDEIAEEPLEIEYISILAQAQKMGSLTNVMQFLQSFGAVAQLNPESLDKIDSDALVDVIADATGIPERILRDPKRVAAMREQRAQSQAVAQNATLLQSGSETAKTLSDIDPTQNSVLKAMMGGMGGGQ